MFTGIIEELGQVSAIELLPDDAMRLTIRGSLVISDASIGDSIAVNGVCLTVASQTEDSFTADVMAETLHRTSLGELVVGATVNLERPVTLATRLGGHLVQGHVDGLGEITARRPSEHWEVVSIRPAQHLMRYIVEKGSITVDGTSLTVASITDTEFTVSLIPATLEKTTLGTATVGSRVNLEVDVLAKYVEKLLAGSK